ncbi:MAG TPA: LapA family protein [Woeseiaceae bacterium]|nr:LapA family protein [Woeseiaceae bacterium]
MIKRIGLILLVLLILGLMLVFTRLNPGSVEVDLAVGTFQSSIPLAFTVAFAAGWLFGLLCMALAVARLVNERRRLRKSLRNTEVEISSLRNLPLSDAD